MHVFISSFLLYRNLMINDSTNYEQLLQVSEYSSSIHIHFAKNHHSDKVAAERLANLKNVNLYPWETDTHNIAGWLKSQQKLDSVLDVF